MARANPAADRSPIECGCGCKATFTPRRSDQRFASATCRKRGDRAAKAAAAGAAEEAKTETDAEHQLVKAMRLELVKAGVVDTYKAQLALQLGRKLVDPSEKASTVTSLSKEIDRVMADAIGAKPEGGTDDAAGDQAEPEDEVTRARRARAEARQAAGLT